MADALRCLLLSLLVLATSCAQCGHARQWVNDRGQRVEGELIRVSKSTAYLRVNGKTVEAPLDRLSEADRRWIHAYQEAHKYRDWETRDGQTRRARFLRVDGDTVVFQHRGEEIELPLSDLMDEGQQLIASVSDEVQPPLRGPTPFGPPSTAGSPNGVLPRQWTSNDGKTITAKFGGLEDGKVVLLMNGKEFRVPQDRLSAADQAYIARQQTGPPAAAAVAETREASSDFPSMNTDFESRHEQLMRESRERMEKMRAEMEARHEQRVAEMTAPPSAPTPDKGPPDRLDPPGTDPLGIDRPGFDRPAGPDPSDVADSSSSFPEPNFPVPRAPSYVPPVRTAPVTTPLPTSAGDYNVIICGKCKNENRLPFNAGDKCRKCGTRIDMIENEDGSIQSSSPQYWARNVRGMIFGGIFVASMIGALIKKFA